MSKLIRAGEDALTGVVYDDDAQIVPALTNVVMSLEITNIPVPSSPSPPFPNLGDVITTDDVSQKGTGKYTADYVNWCRVAHLLQDNAPGWQFHLAHYVDSSHVWKAPNGTGYVVGYFTGPNGERTPDFPQAVMDFKNNPVPYEKITARDVTDTHRRALAALRCFHIWIGLAVVGTRRGRRPDAA